MYTAWATAANQELAAELGLEAAKGTAEEAAKQVVLDAASTATTTAMLTALLSTAGTVAEMIGEEDLAEGLGTVLSALGAYGGYTSTTTMSTGELIGSIISALNKGFTMYSQSVNPPVDNSLLDAVLQEQEKQLSNTAGPEKIDVVWREWGDPFSFPEKMDEMCYVMTAGRNRTLMHEHYNCNF